MSKKGGVGKVMHLYKTFVKNQKISFENFEKVMHNIYLFLIEYDQFKNDYYHQIFDYVYIRKLKYNQAYIAQALGMDQSTISRKLNEIRKYIIIKLYEVK